MRMIRSVLKLFGLLFLLVSSAALADEKPGTDEFIANLRTFYLQRAEAMQFSKPDSDTPFALEKKPVLTWTSTGDGLWSGDVFVWAGDGRPEVIGCIGSWPIDEDTRGVFEEFHSLSTGPLNESDLDKSLKWKSESPGVMMADIPAADAPAADARRRLSQMRRITDRFKAHMRINNAPEELRLLTQPLYRYSGSSSTIVDGAVFAYVTTAGTDPEVLLLLECHKEGNTQTWKYAAVRFTHRELWLKLDDSEVWRVTNHNTPYRSSLITDTYLSRPTEPVSIDDVKALKPK